MSSRGPAPASRTTPTTPPRVPGRSSAIASLAALGGLTLVGRKVVRSVSVMNELQGESARLALMVENSPTNTMFCTPDMTISYMNPASLRNAAQGGAPAAVQGR